jgi:hypothetical protein
MIAWLVRILVIVSGFMASWFVTKDSPQFCCDANGSHIAGCGAHSGRVGVLARAVDSHP